MGRLLKLCLTALLFTLAFMKGPTMAENLDHGYSAKIYTRNTAWSLRVNDLFVRENGDVAYATSSGDIGPAMQPGKNTLSLLFSPLTGKSPETGEYEYELRDGVFIDIIIERYDYARGSQEVHPVRIRYDGDEEKFVSDPKTEGGLDRVLSQPLIRTDGNYTITELKKDQKAVYKTGQMIGGYRLDVEFEVKDEAIPPMHWAGKAVPLEDTPELRRELLHAYERIYSMIERGDKEAIFREAEPIWERTALILTSQSSAQAFVENSELGLERYQKIRPDGAALKSLAFASDIENVSLQFTADHRLVRVRPDPIRWEGPPAGSENYKVFPVVFYKTADGEWHLADINIGL